ncbi:MAG: LysM peptidoglycan-binding domain-containing protein [Candidatus Hydrogenedens sp.]|nr:LysM peptidoglycan-binding domain-containing protein [Candidatus Hydrogenedens sp.]
MSILNRRFRRIFGGFSEGRSSLAAALLLVGLVLGGCAHSPDRIAQFDPIPPEEMDVTELDSSLPPAVSDLLRQAEASLQRANAAHEQGDQEGAIRHYQQMFSLLQEAELDPALNYASRDLFEKILTAHLRHSHLYHDPGTCLGQASSEVYSDIVIPTPLPPQVLVEIQTLQNEYSGTFQRGLDRSSIYMPHLRHMFREAGLPEELAWLAMVESMFRTKVISPAGAGGMWQFMRGTARHYKMRMDQYVDERFDWYRSTETAICYLKNLHNFFNGDWALAVTAYNMGEGGLDRTLTACGGERDLWTLLNNTSPSNKMKDESKKYYPRLLAYIIVTHAPEQYGFTAPVEPALDMERIPVQGSYTLASLEEAAGLSKGTLAAWNPDLLREMTPVHGEYMLSVPGQQRNKMLAALSTVKPVPLPAASAPILAHSGGTTYKVKRGDSISKIARHHGVSESALMKVNNIKSARSLKANQVLQLPGTGSSQQASNSGGHTATAAAQKNTPTAAQKGADITYTVKKGDTLSKIAQSHKVSMNQLQKWNKIPSNKMVHIGQVLKVGEAPVQVAAAASSSKDDDFHLVKPGEYPAIIAELYDIPLSDFLAWNKLNSSSIIRTGDKLIVSGSRSSSSGNTTAKRQTKAPEQKEIIHKVAKGETAGSIAKKHNVSLNDLLSWNKLTTKSVLRVGQSLKIKTTAVAAAGRDRQKDLTVSQASAAEKVVHKVRAGQNPTSIARHYGVAVNDLYKWNNWKKDHILRIGDEVSIYK